MRFKAEHVFTGISLDDYEQLYFDEEFNKALCQAVKLARTLEKREVNDGHISRIVKVGPQREVPAPVAKIIGANRLEYAEHLEYDFGSYEVQWKTVPVVLQGKILSSGTVKFAEESNGVRRTVDGEIKVKIFGVGAIAEKFIVAETEKSYDDAARFTQQWIDEKAS